MMIGTTSSRMNDRSRIAITEELPPEAIASPSSITLSLPRDTSLLPPPPVEVVTSNNGRLCSSLEVDDNDHHNDFENNKTCDNRNKHQLHNSTDTEISCTSGYYTHDENDDDNNHNNNHNHEQHFDDNDDQDDDSLDVIPNESGHDASIDCSSSIDDSSHHSHQSHNNNKNNYNDSMPSRDDRSHAERKRTTRKRRLRHPDTVRVATIHELEATMPLLATVPVWVFDFKHRKNRWASPAGLKFWDSPSLEEFVSRDMRDISPAIQARTQRVQDRVERGHVVQEQWTFYPKGKAKTVNLIFNGTRLSEDEDWISLFCYVLPISKPCGGGDACSSSSIRNKNNNNNNNNSKEKVVTSTQRNGECNVPVTIEEDNDAIVKSNETLNKETSSESNMDIAEDQPSMTTADPNSQHQISNSDEQVDKKETVMYTSDRDFVNEETLRGVEIIRHLPIAVCQFDLSGKLMFQNPAAFMPSLGYRGDYSDEDENDDDSNYVDNVGSNTRTRKSENATPVSFDQGFRNEDFVPRFVDPKIGQGLLDNIKKAYEDPSIVSYGNMDGNITLEAELHTRFGPKWSSIQLRRTFDPVTSQPVILYSAQDKSDAILARREREARVKKSEFLAIMAHEIRTPLHQVTGFIDLLDQNMAESKLISATNRRRSMASLPGDMKTKEDFEQQRSFVRLLKSSASQLLTVINDVLDYSKLEVGEMKFESIPYEPLSVVEGSMAAVRQSCAEKGLTLTLGDWEEEIPFKLIGDPNRLRQILLNLLSNAIKFTTNGEISVHVECLSSDSPLISQCTRKIRRDEHNEDEGDECETSDEHGWIKFMVSDTGIGISEENRGLVFKKYQQANLSVARQFGGTGLGLSICHLLVKTMGGMIDVESELGKGSSFYFVLPMRVPRKKTWNGFGENHFSGDEDDSACFGPDSQMRRSSSVNPSSEKDNDHVSMNILVAEDNKINQKLVVNMLKRMGHQSTVADDGQQAIDLICQNTSGDSKICCTYDVVLMDIQMPKMDGLEATRRLRTMGYKELPIVGLTASVKRADYEDLGFNDWLPKPILMKDLKAKLARFRTT